MIFEQIGKTARIFTIIRSLLLRRRSMTRSGIRRIVPSFFLAHAGEGIHWLARWTSASDRMRRREFLALTVGSAAALVSPEAAYTQQPTKVHRIFWVSTESQPDPFLDGFREGLRGRGYVEGQNVVFELHYAAGDLDALRRMIYEL